MNRELHVALDDAEFLAVFPMKGEGHARLIGTVKDTALDAQRPLEWSDVSGTVLGRLGVNVERINWFSTYHVHHRVASRFRSGRAFLLGDAAHVHSPVGAQGMNTGIGDAVNLAWKLAAVLQQRSPEKLLDTYEPERIAFAHRLVASTDRAFQMVTSDGAAAHFIRTRVVPYLMPIVFARSAMQRFMFRTISQTAIEYRHSALSAGAGGKVRAGDRLPWVRLGDDAAADNFEPLSTLEWQMHVYGAAPPAMTAACRSRAIPLHTFAWRDDMRRAGFVCNAAYLVRPDGYIGCVDDSDGAERLVRYLDEWVVTSGANL